jgi:hypothetical protein
MEATTFLNNTIKVINNHSKGKGTNVHPLKTGKLSDASG